MNSFKENTLPAGWKNKEFGDVCKILNGRAYKKTELLSKGKYKVLRVGNLFTNNSWYWSDLELKEDKYISNGDLIYAWSASFGPRLWEGEKVIYHYHIWKVVNGKELSKDFLFYWLDWKTETIKRENTSGTTMIHVTKGMMESLVIHYPKIEEQKRIVAKIDGSFAKINKAISLTEESLKQAKNLLPSVLKEVFEKGKSDGWEEKKWDEVLEIKNGKSQKEYLVSEGGYPIYGSGGVMNGRVSKFLCPNNTTIIGRKGTIDKPKYVEEEFWNVDTAFGLCAKTGLNPRFLYYFCLTFNFRSLNKSTTLPSLTKRDLLQISMPYTNSKNQNKVVKIANDILLKSKQTQSKFEEQLTHLKNLKSSILSKAFAGELL